MVWVDMFLRFGGGIGTHWVLVLVTPLALRIKVVGRGRMDRGSVLWMRDNRVRGGGDM